MLGLQLDVRKLHGIPCVLSNSYISYFLSPMSFDEMRLLSVIGLCSFLCIDHFRACCAFTTPSPMPSFVNTPSGSTTVFEYGETRTVVITMNCKVSNLQPDQKVSWLKGIDDVAISDDHTVRTEHVSPFVDNDRYSIYGDETHGEYNLQIVMVSYQTAEFDSGRYQCAVFHDDPTILPAVLRSNVVQQNIYALPRMIYPQCFVSNVNATFEADVIEGEAVLLLCQSDPGYPTVDMAWNRVNSSTILNDNMTVKDNIASIQYTWIPSVNDGSVIFKCAIDHPAFRAPNVERSRTTCSVGPFNIHPRTTTEYHHVRTLHSDYVSEEETVSTTSNVGNDLDGIHVTIKTTTTPEIKRQQYLPSSEKCSASVLGGTFIGGLMLGVAITIISGAVYITVRRWKAGKPDERNTMGVTTASGKANVVELEETGGHQNDTQYEVITANIQDAHYQSLTDRSQNEVYTSLKNS